MRRPLVLLATALTLLAAAAPAAANGRAAPPRPCNGDARLCARTLDRVVLPGTHNSMSAASLGWAIPNQSLSIPAQLRRGARTLLIDTHYGIPQADGRVITDDARVKPGPRGPYLCHVLCEIGATPLTSGLRDIARFLRANPREVLVIVNEDYITPQDYAASVRASGLLRYVYRGSTRRWPTLGTMVARGQRVVMFAQDEVGEVPWYHLAYDGLMRETPYEFRPASALTDRAQLAQSCRPNRGGNRGRLFLMNHWVSPEPPSLEPLRADAALVNTRAAIVNRARACRTARGRLPNLIAVDFFGTGDVVGAARVLNGLSRR